MGAIVQKLKLFRGGMFMQGEPLVARFASFSEYIVFPGAMLAALWYCPEDDPRKTKSSSSS